jgi:hypothetical protein
MTLHKKALSFLALVSSLSFMAPGELQPAQFFRGTLIDSLSHEERIKHFAHPYRGGDVLELERNLGPLLR